MTLRTQAGLDTRVDQVHQKQSSTHRREVFNTVTDYDFLETRLGAYLKETFYVNRYLQVMAGIRLDAILYDIRGTQDLAYRNICTNQPDTLQDVPVAANTYQWNYSPKAAVVITPYENPRGLVNTLDIYLNYGEGFEGTRASLIANLNPPDLSRYPQAGCVELPTAYPGNDHRIPKARAAEGAFRWHFWDERVSLAASLWWADKEEELVFEPESGISMPRGASRRIGQEVAFDHFFVNLSGPTAIQGEAGGGAHTASVPSAPGGARIQHAGHPHTGITTGTVHAALVGDYLVDLHQSPHAGLDPDEERTLVGSVSHVDGLGNRVFTGNYNTLNFNIKPVDIAGGSYTGSCPAMDAGECEDAALAMQGYSLRMTGTATCVEAPPLCTLDEVVGFDIRLFPVLSGEDALGSGISWSSCTWEGDEPDPGLVEANGTGRVEMTFHADHIFGDFEAEASDPINVFALGFAPFRGIAGDTGCEPDEDFCITADQAELLAAWETGAALQPELQYAYPMLISAVAGMGHCGEGHCLH